MTSSPSPQHVHSHGPLLPRLLDLDAIVQSPMLDEAVSIAAGLSEPEVTRRILDVGAGTGTGTVALARRFAAAEVVALDIDDGMLDRVRDRAAAEGLAGRVTTILADVASDSPPLGTADLVWSAAALHEVADPARALRTLFDALRPGGHLVVMEMDALPLLLPPALAGLEGRVRAAAGSTRATDHPDWAAGIEAAGVEMLLTRTLVTDRTMPASGPAGDYAALELRRLGHVAMPRLGEEDRQALLTLAGDGPGNVRELGGPRIRGTRTLWAARRP
jgi:SAM-dependent methyltransferase